MDSIIIDDKEYELILTFKKENNDEYEYVIYKDDVNICGGKYNVNEANRTLITDLTDDEKMFINEVYGKVGGSND